MRKLTKKELDNLMLYIETLRKHYGLNQKIRDEVRSKIDSIYNDAPDN